MKSITIAIVIAIAILSTSTAARAEKMDGTRELEALVKTDSTTRIVRVLQKYKVKNAAFYARLLSSTPMSEFERRLFTYKLVLETRGDANAVSSEGALGPWQLHPIHLSRFKVTRRQAKDPALNLRLCLRVYRTHLVESGGKIFGYKGAIWRYSGGSDWYPKKIWNMMREA